MSKLWVEDVIQCEDEKPIMESPTPTKSTANQRRTPPAFVGQSAHNSQWLLGVDRYGKQIRLRQNKVASNRRLTCTSLSRTSLDGFRFERRSAYLSSLRQPAVFQSRAFIQGNRQRKSNRFREETSPLVSKENYV